MKKTLIFLGLLLGGLVFLIKPRCKKNKETRGFLDYSYAHRGLHDKESPENTLAAIKKAVEAGYGIEMDVRVSKDGLVIHHDEDLLRSTGLDRKLSDFSTSELAQMKVFSSQETIASLEEALGLIGARVPLLLEIKSESNHFDTASRVQALMDNYEGAYMIESFHPLVLYWYRKNRPQVIRGQLSGPNLDQGLFNDFMMKYLLYNFISRPDFIAYEKQGGLAPWLASKLGLPSFCYTLKSPEEKKEYFDGVIFEDYLA